MGRWVTTAQGRRLYIPDEGEENPYTKQIDKEIADKERQIAINKAQADKLNSKTSSNNDKIAKIRAIKDLDDIDREEMEYLYKETGGAWVHSDKIERIIADPLSGRKTATENSLRRNFEDAIRAWKDVRNTVENKDAIAFLDKQIKDYTDRFEANMKKRKGTTL